MIPTSSTTMPRSAFEVDPDLNLRKTYSPTKHAELCESIPQKGVLRAVGLWEYEPGKFKLIEGFRRMRAVDDLIAQKVLHPDFPVPVYIKNFRTLAEAKLANAAADEGHEPVKRYEVATRFVEMLDRGEVASEADIAKETGMRLPHVKDLVRCRRKLHPKIIEAWRDAPSVEWETPVNVLKRWTLLAPAVQLEAFQDYVPIPIQRKSKGTWLRGNVHRPTMITRRQATELKIAFDRRKKEADLTSEEKAAYQMLCYVLREIQDINQAGKGFFTFKVTQYLPETQRRERKKQEKADRKMERGEL